jgi:Xaa-Pro aminopeptidase
MPRLNELKKKLDELGLDAFLIKKIFNVRYLSGFSGSAGVLLLTKNKNYFISDFRYKSQSSAEVSKDFEIIIYKQASNGFLGDLIKENNLKKIGVEGNALTLSEFESLKKEFSAVEFIPVDSLIEKAVIRKTEWEIGEIKKAVEITDRVFEKMLTMIKPGLTEKEIAAEITYHHKKFGAEKDAFDPIVASGERSAFPHARPTDKKIQSGELVTLDFGCTFNGFNSDLTRTIAVGKIPDDAVKIYNIVKEAQQLGLDNVRIGIKGKDLDAFPRNYITEKGYGDNFGHGTGHGLGLEVHEIPKINQYSEYVLEENNVFTVEPGIYVEGFCGVRIEDDVVVRKNGCEILNKSPKELIYI